MRALFRTTRFKKDYKKLANADKLILKTTITTIVNNQLLDKKYQDLIIQPFYNYLDIARSSTYKVYRPNGSVFGNIFEPRSKTRLVGIRLNYVF